MDNQPQQTPSNPLNTNGSGFTPPPTNIADPTPPIVNSNPSQYNPQPIAQPTPGTNYSGSATPGMQSEPAQPQYQPVVAPEAVEQPMKLDQQQTVTDTGKKPFLKIAIIVFVVLLVLSAALVGAMYFKLI
jgi:hypothetical protein